MLATIEGNQGISLLFVLRKNVRLLIDFAQQIGSSGAQVIPSSSRPTRNPPIEAPQLLRCLENALKLLNTCHSSLLLTEYSGLKVKCLKTLPRYIADVRHDRRHLIYTECRKNTPNIICQIFSCSPAPWRSLVPVLPRKPVADVGSAGLTSRLGDCCPRLEELNADSKPFSGFTCSCHLLQSCSISFCDDI
jgi:hypothetical protein